MLEAASGEQNRQVRIVVRRRIAEVTGVENRRPIEQVVVSLAARPHLFEKLAEDGQFGFLD
jgi:hypothetical protein